MSYDESLAARCRQVLGGQHGITEKRMFGGLSFLLDGHMICGVLGRQLVIRVGLGEAYERALREPHVKPMDFTGRPLRGFVYVLPDGLGTKAALSRWLGRAVKFGEGLPAKK